MTTKKSIRDSVEALLIEAADTFSRRGDGRDFEMFQNALDLLEAYDVFAPLAMALRDGVPAAIAVRMAMEAYDADTSPIRGNRPVTGDTVSRRQAQMMIVTLSNALLRGSPNRAEVRRTIRALKDAPDVPGVPKTVLRAILDRGIESMRGAPKSQAVAAFCQGSLRRFDDAVLSNEIVGADEDLPHYAGLLKQRAHETVERIIAMATAQRTQKVGDTTQ